MSAMTREQVTGDGGTGLPASIEAAWGLRGRPSRGPKPGLSLERIVQAGIAVASAEGLEGLTIAYMAAFYTFLKYSKARIMS